MPLAMRTIDQIMAAEQRDMYSVKFKGMSFRNHNRKAEREQMAWFAAQSLRTEHTAPNGWLMGDAGIRAVHFDGPDDPRLKAYESVFEDGTGKSKRPCVYQMVFMRCADWKAHRDANPLLEWTD